MAMTIDIEALRNLPPLDNKEALDREFADKGHIYQALAAQLARPSVQDKPITKTMLWSYSMHLPVMFESGGDIITARSTYMEHVPPVDPHSIERKKDRAVLIGDSTECGIMRLALGAEIPERRADRIGRFRPMLLRQQLGQQTLTKMTEGIHDYIDAFTEWRFWDDFFGAREDDPHDHERLDFLGAERVVVPGRIITTGNIRRSEGHGGSNYTGDVLQRLQAAADAFNIPLYNMGFSLDHRDDNIQF